MEQVPLREEYPVLIFFAVLLGIMAVVFVAGTSFPEKDTVSEVERAERRADVALEVVRAQQAYYQAHGRYAADIQQLAPQQVGYKRFSVEKYSKGGKAVVLKGAFAEGPPVQIELEKGRYRDSTCAESTSQAPYASKACLVLDVYTANDEIAASKQERR